MAVGRWRWWALSPSLCRSAEPSILLCVLRRPCRSYSLAPSPPGAATFLSVPRRRPSLSAQPSVGARAFFHSIDLPSAVSLSFHACAALPFRSNDRARGRERGPCRRCSPSSSLLNTAAILLPPDQVRSRCSLVCSLGWMEHGTSGAHSIPFPAPPLVPRTSCDSAIAMLAGAWCHILHPQCAALSASRGCVGRPRTGARATSGSLRRSSYSPPTRERIPKKVSHARTMEPVLVGS